MKKLLTAAGVLAVAIVMAARCLAGVLSASSEADMWGRQTG
jgi:hypothetical protein